MTWIGTYTGRKFDFNDFKLPDIDIEDIAHSLSLKCRFGGHTPVHYSVAQHSVIVAQLLPDEHKGWGLLHDAAETYTGDISAAFKPRLYVDYGGGKPVGMSSYENMILSVIAEVFKLPFPMPRLIHEMDHMVTVTEGRIFMKNPIHGNAPDFKWLAIIPLSAEDAERQFLESYEKYFK